jgi:hypothetical protein
VYGLGTSHLKEGIILAIAVNEKEQDRETFWGQGSVTPESLFHRHYKRLVGALAVACGSREMAADAVQDAFVELCKRWEKISRYEVEACRAWGASFRHFPNSFPSSECRVSRRTKG